MTTDAPPPIDTPRLILRPIARPPAPDGTSAAAAWDRDRAFFAAVRADPATIAWHLDGRADASLAATDAWMQRQTARPWGSYLAELRSAADRDAIIVAAVGIIRPADRPPPSKDEAAPARVHGPEIAYLAHPDHRGHGYATEAVRALIAAFWEAEAEQTSMTIEAETDSDNGASQKVLERCGFRMVQRYERDRYSEAQGAWQDALVWRLDRPEGRRL